MHCALVGGGDGCEYVVEVETSDIPLRTLCLQKGSGLGGRTI